MSDLCILALLLTSFLVHIKVDSDSVALANAGDIAETAAHISAQTSAPVSQAVRLRSQGRAAIVQDTAGCFCRTKPYIHMR